jgi:hypothetical protein
MNPTDQRVPAQAADDAGQLTLETASLINEQTGLRAKAREAILAGRLPRRRPAKTWGGPGAGLRCTICGSPVGHDEMELEIEFRDDAGRNEHHVHVPCFAAWEVELHQLERARSKALK